ncbi:MAG: GNAT family N-acetyltransferase [Selenomonas ruminantium]|uniref:GNAT family N-acetyltransferase n=1 Tax=Selenomonas ruminantium TaxID=971 RepID=A0A927WSU5_SELRU|nr:GNAT family N-acetyltransferase [Selenomonas ruminantium]
MMDILIEGSRLRLRKAVEQDLDFILDLEYAEDNLPFIVPFDRDFHTNIVTKGEASMDVIVEEVETGEPVGYFLVAGLKTDAKEMEWTHVIIAKKGMGYGHEAMQLIKKWCFAVKKFHRAWLDCKDYNTRALHLYESEGMVREGLIRETILTNGVYENLVILGILDREYEARRAAGQELK